MTAAVMSAQKNERRQKMSLFQGILAILWPVAGFLQAFMLAPEMFFEGFVKWITQGHL